MNKKKVLVFIGSLTSGGAERVAVGLSRFLSKKNDYSVTLVTLDSKERDFYTLDPKVQRISMDMGGETRGAGKFLINMKRVAAFRKILKKGKPDLVLAMITRHAVIALLASVFLNIKVIVSERNYPGHRKNHTMWEMLRKYTYRYADLHVVQTKKIADWVRINTNSSDVRVIPNSVSLPLHRYKPIINPEDYLKKNEKYILAVGSFKHQKGFDLLLEAATGILDQFPEWRLVILGEEKDESGSSGLRIEFEKLIEYHKLGNQILLPGKAGNVGDWYARAEIFVLSSRYEGFPNVLLEAMAYGCACISFDCDTGPGDLIHHNHDGLLVPAEDVDELAKNLLLLMNSSKKRKELSTNAKDVLVRYSENKINNQWSEVLIELVS